MTMGTPTPPMCYNDADSLVAVDKPAPGTPDPTSEPYNAYRFNGNEPPRDVRRASSRAVGVLLLVLLVLTGCQSDGERDRADANERADLADQVSIDYDRVGGAGYIDQALTVRNSSQVPVTIEAEIELLDSSGAVLPQVAAHGVYGATEGRQVLVPGENVDFLVFTGEGASEERDVQLADVRLKAYFSTSNAASTSATSGQVSRPDSTRPPGPTSPD